MSALEWRYLPRGTVTHAFQRAPVGYASALCGVAPLWYEPRSDWYGTGSQVEYERAAALPKCRRCLRLLGGAT